MLIKPTPADELLKSAGIEDQTSNNLKSLLTNNFLGLDDVLNELSGLVHGASQEGNKLRAIESSLKLHKVLEEDKSVPSIIINIQPPSGEASMGIPRILIPRALPSQEITIDV